MQSTLSLPCMSSYDVVVLLHGLFATKRSMVPAKRLFEDQGFFAINFGYATCRKTVQAHMTSLMPLLLRLEGDSQIRKIHFLAHSFGSILLRYALHLEEFRKLGRAVMLAPPNAGTPLAKYSMGAFDRLIPAIRQLSEEPSAIPKRLTPPSNLEIGIVAAQHDFIVGSVDHTYLPGQADHCTVATSHFVLPKHPTALQAALRFIATGNFCDQNARAATPPSSVGRKQAA